MSKSTSATSIENTSVLSAVSLKGIAFALNLTNDRISAVAKQPIPGAVYDPDAVNYVALEKFVTRRLPIAAVENSAEPAKAHPEQVTLEEVVAEAQRYDATPELQATKRASSGSFGGGDSYHNVKVKSSYTDEEFEALRFPHLSISTINQATNLPFPVLLKKDPYVYQPIAQTAGYTVYRKLRSLDLLGTDGTPDFLDDTFRIVANQALNWNAVQPSENYAAQIDANLALSNDSEALKAYVEANKYIPKAQRAASADAE